MAENKHSNRVLISSGIPEFALNEYEKLKGERNQEPSTLDMKNIDKVYEDGFQAVFGTSIKLEKGEFLALLGPSGCGKTTTLRMIAGLEEVTSGEVHIGGVDSTHLEPSDRSLTMVFQNYALFPHLSVKGNISFGLKANKKKLGKGGEVYTKQSIMRNELISKKITLKNIVTVEKLNLRVANLEAKLELKEEKMIIANSQFEEIKSTLTESKLEKAEAKINAKRIDIKALETTIEKGKEKSAYYTSIADTASELEADIERLKAEITDMEITRKEVAQDDNYAEIIANKVEEAANVLGLEYYLDRKPSALSGGQRQRVALGRSIVGTPSLFLMDEPLSNLDAKLRASMRRQIRELHEKINTATVYVTHDQVEAMTMADKIAVMSDGFVMQVGSPKDVYKNPSCAFVASFVGLPSMNMYNGVISNGMFTSDDGLTIRVPKDKMKNVVEGKRVILGMRPTDISTEKDVLDTYKSKLTVKITARELLGNEIQYTGQVEGSSEEVTFITSSYQDEATGSTIDIQPLLSRLHIFDEDTTIALTSEFNFETLHSLKNWSVSGDKIEVRRTIMEAARKRSMRKSWTTLGIDYIKNTTKKVISKMKDKRSGKTSETETEIPPKAPSEE